MIKKLLCMAMTTALAFSIFVSASFADTTQDQTVTTDQTVTAPEETTSTGTNDQVLTTENADEVAGTTPDNWFYSFERMMESVQMVLTPTQEGKAELLISFANERLAEAQIMTEKNQQELVKAVMDAYSQTMIEIGDKVEEAVEEGQDVQAVLDEVIITQNNAEWVVIKATGLFPEETVEQLKVVIDNAVKNVIVDQAAATANESFENAKLQLEKAKEELVLAQATGDAAAITAAELKLQQTQTFFDQMKETSELIVAFQELWKEENEETEETDKDDDSKIAEKDAKIQSLIKKHEDKRNEMIQKLQDKSGKASEKMQENLDKWKAKQESRLSTSGQETTEPETTEPETTVTQPVEQTIEQQSIAQPEQEIKENNKNAGNGNVEKSNQSSKANPGKGKKD